MLYFEKNRPLRAVSFLGLNHIKITILFWGWKKQPYRAACQRNLRSHE